MLVATAGHIDHGKTALVRALSGVETDRLPEEQARGISIDLGFAYWRPDTGDTIGFIDVPGHERFLRNMLAGVSGVQFALLVIAADDGIMPQTVEHLRILGLLGIRRGIVALTKTDKVETARLEEVRQSVDELLAASSLVGAQVFAVSSLTGEGIPELATALLAERAAQASDPAHHFRLAIDRAFSVTGAGTVVTGTVLAGHAAPGDMLAVSPLGREVRVRGLQSGGRKVDAIGPGERCAVNLAGIEVSELHRGDRLVAPAAHAPTSRIEARFTLLADRAAPLRHDTRVHLHIGAADIGARLLLTRQRALDPGDEALARLVLDEPGLAVSGDRFILRDQSGRELLGGGVALDPLASPKRRSPTEREARAVAMTLPPPADKLAAMAAAAGVEAEIGWFTQACNLTSEAVEQLLEQGSFVLTGKNRSLVIAAERQARLASALISSLAMYHRDHPGEGGMPRRLARIALGETVSADLFAALVCDLVIANRIEVQGALLRLPGHSASFSQIEIDAWRKVLATIEDRTPRPIVVAELARELRGSEAALSATLQRRKVSGDVWQVTDTKFMLRQHVASLVALAAELAATSPEGFTAAQLRDASGIGRNFIIQLLEFFDRIGVTRRNGERRRMRGDWEAVVGPGKA